MKKLKNRYKISTFARGSKVKDTKKRQSPTQKSCYEIKFYNTYKNYMRKHLHINRAPLENISQIP